MQTTRRCIPIFIFVCLAALGCSEVNSDDIPDCSRTFCGCWKEVTLEFSTKILDKQDRPLSGIEVYCTGEESPRSVSDQSGAASFEVTTQYSPGCHYAICTNLTFRDKSQMYTEQQLTVYQTNGHSVHLMRTK